MKAWEGRTGGRRGGFSTSLDHMEHPWQREPGVYVCVSIECVFL